MSYVRHSSACDVVKGAPTLCNVRAGRRAKRLIPKTPHRDQFRSELLVTEINQAYGPFNEAARFG